MRVLIGCEVSGMVRRAFAARGHFAVSVDTQPADDGASYGTGNYDQIRSIGAHYQGDLRDFIYGDAGNMMDAGFDLLIAFPPCTFLSVSGLHWNTRGRGEERTEQALEFVRQLMTAPFGKIAIENPVGCISTRIRKPDQTIQPYHFGHDASKRTCLWLKNLPKLRETKFAAPRIVCPNCGMVTGLEPASAKGCPACGTEPGLLRPRWSNQTDSGQNKLGPSPERAKLRSETYQGIADAMAQQWG